MKKLLTLALAMLSAILMVSCCQSNGDAANDYPYDGTWALARIGNEVIPLDDQNDIMVIKQHRTYEDNIENGRIEKQDDQYYLFEKVSAKKYPCELKSDTLTFHTPKDDPDFEGKDIVYRKK